MNQAIITALVYAINAIENVPVGIEVTELMLFCEQNGLPETAANALIAEPGPTDHGRMTRCLEGLEAENSQPDDATDDTQNAEPETDSGNITQLGAAGGEGGPDGPGQTVGGGEAGSEAGSIGDGAAGDAAASVAGSDDVQSA